MVRTTPLSVSNRLGRGTRRKGKGTGSLQGREGKTPVNTERRSDACHDCFRCQNLLPNRVEHTLISARWSCRRGGLRVRGGIGAIILFTAASLSRHARQTLCSTLDRRCAPILLLLPLANKIERRARIQCIHIARRLRNIRHDCRGLVALDIPFQVALACAGPRVSAVRCLRAVSVLNIVVIQITSPARGVKWWRGDSGAASYKSKCTSGLQRASTACCEAIICCGK